MAHQSKAKTLSTSGSLDLVLVHVPDSNGPFLKSIDQYRYWIFAAILVLYLLGFNGQWPVRDGGLGPGTLVARLWIGDGDLSGDLRVAMAQPSSSGPCWTFAGSCRCRSVTARFGRMVCQGSGDPDLFDNVGTVGSHLVIQ